MINRMCLWFLRNFQTERHSAQKDHKQIDNKPEKRKEFLEECAFAFACVVVCASYCDSIFMRNSACESEKSNKEKYK